VKSRFHDEAEADLLEDLLYYDDASSGLGDQLLSEVRTAVSFLESFPEAGPVVAGAIRAKTLVRFPHTLLYSLENDTILILAVAHQRQDREAWLQIVSNRRGG
jgi:plasmid stabilization system protein ParE